MPVLKKVCVAAVALSVWGLPAFAGSPNAYVKEAQQPTITTFTANTPSVDPMDSMSLQPIAAPIAAQPYYEPLPPVYESTTAAVAAPSTLDGRYDSRYGDAQSIGGYQQSAACGGVLDGKHCLVVLIDHMRRVRLDRPAGTILVGNPAVADITVLGKDNVFVSARSIGSTNMIVLDKNGDEIVTYEIFVQEPRSKRVTLRNGGDTQYYQCTPYCKGTFSISGSSDFNQRVTGGITQKFGLDAQAIGLQSGGNPNADPGLGAQGPAGAAGPEGAGAAGALGAAAGGDGLSGNLASSIAGLSQTPGASMASGAMDAMAGGAGGAGGPSGAIGGLLGGAAGMLGSLLGGGGGAPAAAPEPAAAPQSAPPLYR